MDYDRDKVDEMLLALLWRRGTTMMSTRCVRGNRTTGMPFDPAAREGVRFGTEEQGKIGSANRGAVPARECYAAGKKQPIAICLENLFRATLNFKNFSCIGSKKEL